MIINAVNKRFKIKSNLKEIAPVVREIVHDLRTNKADPDIIHDIRLVAEEILINAVKHGNKLNEELYVTIDFKYANNKIQISVQDEGEGYDHASLPDPTHGENITKGHGRGVYLVKKLMDEVRLNKSGNKIEIIKYIK